MDSGELPKHLRGVRRLVVIGDSITELGAEPGGWVSLVTRWLGAHCPAHPVDILNAGVSGHRSSDMLARFDRDVLVRHPDLVAISVGTNDVWHAYHDWATGLDHAAGDLPAGVPLDAFTSNVEAMVRMAEAAGIRTALISPAIISEEVASVENVRLGDYVRSMRRLAAARRCVFIDPSTPFRRLASAWRTQIGRAHV
jgi:acyl-CoA thioesterase I